MDPVTVIAAAVAAGAAAAAKDVATDAVRSAYEALKAYFKISYPDVGLEPVEAMPDSAADRNALAEDLSKSAADQDAELLRLAMTLVELTQRDDPAAGASIGVDLEDVKAKLLTIQGVSAGTIGVRARRIETSNGVEIRDVRVGRDAVPKS